jgi:hypothetical protein
MYAVWEVWRSSVRTEYKVGVTLTDTGLKLASYTEWWNIAEYLIWVSCSAGKWLELCGLLNAPQPPLIMSQNKRDFKIKRQDFCVFKPRGCLRAKSNGHTWVNRSTAHIHTFTGMYVCIMYIYVCMCVCMYVSTYVCLCMCIHVCMDVFMCSCMYPFM